MEEFVASRGWDQPGSPRPHRARNLALSLIIEAAEVLEHFQWSDEAVDKNALESELADVGLYWLQLGSICNIDLEAAILKKLEENHKRTWD